MIVAEQKPIADILGFLPDVEKLLVVGCDTCVTICMAGGEKEVRTLSALIRMARSGIDAVVGTSVERQCDNEFVSDLAKDIQDSDAVLSLACGVGVQMLADAYPGKLILPGLDTHFMGSNDGAGYWVERCLGCGDCVLHLTGGICPRTRCSKGLLNGPCGGSEDGMCEADPQDLECGWNLIYNRLKDLNQLDYMMENRPPRDWSRAHDGGPRKIMRKDVRL